MFFIGPHSGSYLVCKTREVGLRMEAIMIQSMKQGERTFLKLHFLLSFTVVLFCSL